MTFTTLGELLIRVLQLPQLNGSSQQTMALLPLPQAVEANSIYTPTAVMSNYRSTPQSLNVYCCIETAGHVIYEDSLYVSELEETTSVEVTFAPWTIGPVTDVTYTATTITSLTDDTNRYNDTISTHIVTIEEVARGDINRDGHINSLDAVLGVNILLKKHSPSYLEFQAADCNGPVGNCEGDGVINILDIVKIVKLLLGLEQCP